MSKNSRKLQKVVCPASYFAGIEGGKLHFAPQREIQNNNGVCAKCRRTFNRRHAKAMRNGHNNAEDWKEPEHRIKRHYDDEGGNADNRVEGSFDDFNYTALDGPEEQDAALQFAAKALYKFALRLLERGSTPLRLRATLNALCFAAHIHPKQEMTMRELSDKLDSNLAEFSIEVNHWRDLLRLNPVGGSRARSVAVREAFYNAAKRTHEKMGHKIREGSMIDPLFRSLNDATAQANKFHESIASMTSERKQELLERLVPFIGLHNKIRHQLQIS